MSDLNADSKHSDSMENTRKVDRYDAYKRPRDPVILSRDEDDLSELEERFSSHSKNKYYAKVSSGYRTVKLLLVILLTAVIAFVLVLGADNLTYSNLRYLLRNFGEANPGDTERAAVVEFHGADGTQLGVFGGKLAVAGSDSVSLYRLSGKKIYDVSTDISEPLISCGGKYFFVWKCGESDISVFNSVSRVATLSVDGPIYAVAPDDNGSFAVLYKDRVYSSCVAVFDSDLKKTATKNMTSDNAVDIALTNDGGMLYTLSFTAVCGDYVAKLDFSDIIGGTVVHTYTYSGEFPIRCGAFENGGVYALTDKCIYVYSSDGALIYSRTFEASPYRVFDSEKHVCVVSSSGGGAGSFAVVSQSGEIAASGVIDSSVLDGCITDDALFILSSSIVCISLEDGNKQLIGRAPNALGLLCDGDAIYCVYTGRAELIFANGNAVSES